MTKRRGVGPVTGTLLAGLAVVLSACVQNAPQDTLEPAGPFARDIDSLFRPVFWIAVGVFVLVEGLLVVAMVRFRHRPNRPVPVQVHGNKRLEVAWTIAPALLLAVIAFPTIGTIISLDRRPAGNVLDVTVTARQWWWDVRYPSLGVVTANEVHIPVDRPVRVTLTSEDVIHSFWVPRLAGKQDMFPKRTLTLNIQADEPGTYEGQCVEFCGASHANMQFLAIAHESPDFDVWVQGQLAPAPQPPPEVMAVFQNQETLCGACHAIQGVEGVGGTIAPDLTHFGSRTRFAGAMFENTPERLAAWLDNPPKEKPGALMPDYNLTEEQIDALVAYLRSLT